MTKEEIINEWVAYCRGIVSPSFIDDFKRKQVNPSVFELWLKGWRGINMIRVSESSDDADGCLMQVFEKTDGNDIVSPSKYVLTKEEFRLMKSELYLDATEV